MDDIISDFKRFTPVHIKSNCIRCTDVKEVKNVSTKDVKDVKAVKVVKVVKGVKVVKTVDTKVVNDVKTVDVKTVDVKVVNAAPQLTYDDIALKVLPPMKVVLNGGKVVSRNSCLTVSCPHGHVHDYLLLNILKASPKCNTCNLRGATIKNIREQCEQIFSSPFNLVQKTAGYSEFMGGKYTLYIVKSGNTVEQKENSIVVVESTSKILVNEIIYKECSKLGINQAKIKHLMPSTSDVKLLPYTFDHENTSFVKYNMINNAKLIIDNCGWIAI